MQVCTDRSLSQRRQEQNLRTPTTPTPIIPKGLTMSPIPECLSASRPGVLLATQTHRRARRQCNGAFYFGKLYNPFSCPTLNSPTGIRREVGKNHHPFPCHKLRSNIQEGSSSVFWSFIPAPISCRHLFTAASPCSFQAQSLTSGNPLPEPWT